VWRLKTKEAPMKLCKACQQQNRTKGVYCSAICKEQFQAHQKAEQQKVIDRKRLVSNASVHQKLEIDGLPTPKTFVYGEVIDALILRIHATAEKGERFNGYWHPIASDPIIVALGYIKQEIGTQQLDAYGYWKLKSVVINADFNVIQYLWLVLAADFLYRHFQNSYFNSRSFTISAKMNGCIPNTKGVAGGPFYSSGDKGKISRNIGGKVKGSVPPGCSLNGTVLGLSEDELKEYTFAVGEAFYADVQRCPFSSGDWNEDTEFIAQDTSYELPLLLETEIESTLISEEVTKQPYAYGPRRAFGSIPLQWFTHYLKREGDNFRNVTVEWEPVPDWKPLAKQIVDSIVNSLIP
jgi:hypothetical protein